MRKEFPWLNLIAYRAEEVPDIIAIIFIDSAVGEGFATDDLETPAFLRRAFK